MFQHFFQHTSFLIYCHCKCLFPTLFYTWWGQVNEQLKPLFCFPPESVIMNVLFVKGLELIAKIEVALIWPLAVRATWFWIHCEGVRTTISWVIIQSYLSVHWAHRLLCHINSTWTIITSWLGIAIDKSQEKLANWHWRWTSNCAQ